MYVYIYICIYIYIRIILQCMIYIYIDVVRCISHFSRLLRGKQLNISRYGWRCDLFFPTCQARVSRSQWALPDLNRELQSSARGSDPTARARCQWACR